jgi:hypothetical protein
LTSELVTASNSSPESGCAIQVAVFIKMKKNATNIKTVNFSNVFTVSLIDATYII